MSKMTSKSVGFLTALISILIWQQGVQAQEAIVFEVKKNLALQDSEKIIKDYLISQGTEAGLQPGTVVTVVRRVSIYDSYQNRSAGDMLVPVGEVQIIFSQKGLSVARILSVYDRKNLPGLEYEAIMIGDRLDLKSLRKGKVSASDFESREDTYQKRASLDESTPPKPAPQTERKEAERKATEQTVDHIDLNASVETRKESPKAETELSSLSKVDLSSPN